MAETPIAFLFFIESPQPPYLPLKRGGRFAVRAFTRVFNALWQTGWGSPCTGMIPTPTLPFSREGVRCRRGCFNPKQSRFRMQSGPRGQDHALGSLAFG